MQQATASAESEAQRARFRSLNGVTDGLQESRASRCSKRAERPAFPLQQTNWGQPRTSLQSRASRPSRAREPAELGARSARVRATPQERRAATESRPAMAQWPHSALTRLATPPRSLHSRAPLRASATLVAKRHTC